MPRNSSLAGRVALVTGASRGIGLSIARALASNGASVAMTDIQNGSGEAAAQALRDAGANARYMGADVGDEDQIKSLIAANVAAFGRLDIVVNNAAPSNRERVPFPAQTLAGWNADHDVMLRGYMMVAQNAAPHLAAAGGGTIVNISSVLARTISHESCSYHVAKAGVEQLTRYLAYALGPQNIRANAVAPGLIDRDIPPKLTDDVVNKAVVETSVPLGRAATAADIARVVAFLCSDDAAYVTGQIVAVDGGLSLGEPFGVGRRAYYRAQAESEKKVK